MKPSLPRKLSLASKWYLKEIDEPPFFSDEIPTAATIYTKDGRMLCGLNRERWETWTPDERNEVLCHEAGHVSGGHDIRLGQRDPYKWNLICDCAIHHSGGVQPEFVERIGGLTYDKFGIPPVPPEIGYDMIPDPPPQSGCGREGHTGEMSPQARARAIVAAVRGAREMGQHFSNSGHKRELPEYMPEFPEWMLVLLSRLKKTVAYDEPVRRWIRETRRDVEPIMMPGKAPRLGIACTFIWDLSGSISQEDVKKFLGAVEATPELTGSEVVAFSDGVWGPYPVRDIKVLLAEADSGGTRFHQGASKRRSGVPVVWITDGYTGDGWPEPHDAEEYWVISTEVVPPHGDKIQA